MCGGARRQAWLCTCCGTIWYGTVCVLRHVDVPRCGLYRGEGCVGIGALRRLAPALMICLLVMVRTAGVHVVGAVAVVFQASCGCLGRGAFVAALVVW